MTTYFRDIWLGITTVLAGMQVTFKHLFMPTITVQYPRETLPMFPLTRAKLVNHEDECGVCLSCQRVCPVNIFTIKGVRADKGEDLGILPDGKPKLMHLVEFDIDMSKCVYCGLCVEACDTKSLRWDKPQEDAVFTREEMIHTFCTMPAEEKAERIARDEERKQAAEAARKAKMAARKGGAEKRKTGDEADGTVDKDNGGGE